MKCKYVESEVQSVRSKKYLSERLEKIYVEKLH